MFRIESGGLFFWDAFVLEDNQCIYDNLPPEYVALFGELAAASPDHSMLLPREIWRADFIQDAPKHLARTIWERLAPEPARVNVDRLDLKQFFRLDIPSTYISLRQDRALPPGYFHPTMSSRLGAFDFIEMDGSHEALFTRPAEVADRIIEATS